MHVGIEGESLGFLVSFAIVGLERLELLLRLREISIEHPRGVCPLRGARRAVTQSRARATPSPQRAHVGFASSNGSASGADLGAKASRPVRRGFPAASWPCGPPHPPSPPDRAAPPPSSDPWPRPSRPSPQRPPASSPRRAPACSAARRPRSRPPAPARMSDRAGSGPRPRRGPRAPRPRPPASRRDRLWPWHRPRISWAARTASCASFSSAMAASASTSGSASSSCSAVASLADSSTQALRSSQRRLDTGERFELGLELRQRREVLARGPPPARRDAHVAP